MLLIGTDLYEIVGMGTIFEATFLLGEKTSVSLITSFLPQ